MVRVLRVAGFGMCRARQCNEQARSTTGRFAGGGRAPCTAPPVRGPHRGCRKIASDCSRHAMSCGNCMTQLGFERSCVTAARQSHGKLQSPPPESVSVPKMASSCPPASSPLVPAPPSLPKSRIPSASLRYFPEPAILARKGPVASYKVLNQSYLVEAASRRWCAPGRLHRGRSTA